MSGQARVPERVAEYFGGTFDRDSYPVIVRQFRPGHGWTLYPFRKRVSESWLRKMRKEGATAVALASGGREADFMLEELIGKPRGRQTS